MIGAGVSAESGVWDWGLFWAIVAAVVGALALIGVVYAVVGYYRDHPKRQLEYTVSSRRLVESTPKAPLEVRVSGIDVPNPYLVEFRLVSNSRADIPSSSFDAGKGLSIRVQPGGAFVLGDGGARGQIETNGGRGDGWDWAEFDVHPQLIRKESRLELDFISNGPPGVRVTSPLIDVPVVDVTRRPKPTAVIGAWVYVAFSLFMIALTVATPFSNPKTETPLWLTIVLTLLYLGLLAGSIAYLTQQLRWRRSTR